MTKDDFENHTTNSLLDHVVSAVKTLIDWADADVEHQAECGSPGIAREDFARATALRKALELLKQCEKPGGTSMIKAYMLFAANEEELADIASWLDEHPSAEMIAESKIADDIHPRLRALLGRIISEAVAYPLHVPIPHDLAPLLEMTIDDWVEVLTSHNESFLTNLGSVEG